MPTNNSKIIERLNSVIVTPEELSDVLDEADKLHDNGKAEDGDGIYLISSMYRGSWGQILNINY